MELLYTKSHTELIRQRTIDGYVIPIVKKVLEKYPRINSATFAVAQYWDDQASDEVHDFFLDSVLDNPDWEAFARAGYTEDKINLPGFKNRDRWSLDSFRYEQRKNPNIYDWNGLGIDEIAAFAAFCKEGSHQSMDYSEAYTPYAILRRRDNGIVVEIVGKMLRPWLDGVTTERGW